MAYERWAVYSAADHNFLGSVIIDLLIYDKIVMPVPAYDSVFEDWEKKGWNPRVQEKRINQIGKELLIIALWNKEYIQKWKSRMQTLKEHEFNINPIINKDKDHPWERPRFLSDEVIKDDIYDEDGFIKKYKGIEKKFESIDGHQFTSSTFGDQRERDDLLFNNYYCLEARSEKYLLDLRGSVHELIFGMSHNLPRNISKVDLIAPYYDTSNLYRDLGIKERNIEVREFVNEFGLMLQHELLIPANLNSDKTLEKVIELVKKPSFIEARRVFNKWQNEMYASGFTSEEAISEMKVGLHELNANVKSTFRSTTTKSILTLGSISAGVLGAGLGELSALISAGLGTASYLIFDLLKKPDVKKNSPFALFYEFDRIVKK